MRLVPQQGGPLSARISGTVSRTSEKAAGTPWLWCLLRGCQDRFLTFVERAQPRVLCGSGHGLGQVQPPVRLGGWGCSVGGGVSGNVCVLHHRRAKKAAHRPQRPKARASTRNSKQKQLSGYAQASNLHSLVAPSILPATH
jgi:hypothetical protein